MDDRMNVVHPIYNYEINLVKHFLRHHTWILKSRGLGITEIVLRFLAWICLSSDCYAGKFIHIVTGQKEEKAAKLITRLEKILRQNFSDVELESKHTELWLNKTLIQAFPTKALKDLRGDVDVSFMFIDEADFFDPSEQEELPYVIKSYEEKSNCKIIMVSTPNRPDGLFHAIENDDIFKGFFHKERLNYEVGLGKIYTYKFIQREMLEPEFEREYNLKYLGKIGNVFTTSQIEECVRLGELYDKLSFNPYAAHWGGVDYGFSSSKTAVYVGELDEEHNLVRLIIDKEFDKSTPKEVGEYMHEISRMFPPQNLQWFVDGANRGAVNEVKIMFGEDTTWESYKEISWHSNRIIPIGFSVEHIPMLKHYYMLVSRGQLAIPKRMDKLLVAMRTAQAKDFDLDKPNTVNNDHIDAVRLLLKGEISLDDARK